MTACTPKVAVVTGAGSGIGRASTLALLREGFYVVLAGRREARLRETVAEAAELGDRTCVVPTDVTDPEAVRRLFDEALQSFGRLDVLFNNAGVFPVLNPLESLPLDQWQTAIDVNLTGTFLCTQAAFRVMRSQNPAGGRIINNGSISAQVPRPLTAAYAATKHAVLGLTRATALEGRSCGIACGQIDFGHIPTDLTTLAEPDGDHPGAPTSYEGHISLEDAGRTVAYVASLPPTVNVQFMTVIPTDMLFIGRG